jgi:hypothetical protein
MACRDCAESHPRDPAQGGTAPAVRSVRGQGAPAAEVQKNAYQDGTKDISPYPGRKKRGAAPQEAP